MNQVFGMSSSFLVVNVPSLSHNDCRHRGNPFFG